MAWKILWEKQAYRSLTKLNNQIAIEILNALNKLYDDPERVGKPLKGNHKGLHRLRVGDYRVLYAVEGGSNTVKILDVGHRKDIYE